MTRYSEDSHIHAEADKVAILEFELRRATQTINSLRNELTQQVSRYCEISFESVMQFILINPFYFTTDIYIRFFFRLGNTTPKKDEVIRRIRLNRAVRVSMRQTIIQRLTNVIHPTTIQLKRHHLYPPKMQIIHQTQDQAMICQVLVMLAMIWMMTKKRKA